jgi:hypothetical protein
MEEAASHRPETVTTGALGRTSHARFESKRPVPIEATFAITRLPKGAHAGSTDIDHMTRRDKATATSWAPDIAAATQDLSAM